MGPLAACVYGADKALPLHDTYIHALPLWVLTCHMGSHSVTCHPAEVTFPCLPQPVNADTRFSNPRVERSLYPACHPTINAKARKVTQSTNSNLWTSLKLHWTMMDKQLQPLCLFFQRHFKITYLCTHIVNNILKNTL